MSKISDFMKSEQSSCRAMLAINKHGNNVTSHYFKNISVMPSSVFRVFFGGSQNCGCTVFLGLTATNTGMMNKVGGGEQIS